MKWMIVISFLTFCSLGYAQGKSGKDKGGQKQAEISQQQPGQGNSKLRKNIPTPVRNAFNRDYPNAGNVEWTKNRGDWTVHFKGIYFNRSVATYHSNGQRVDTQTPWRREDTPRRVLDSIFRRFPRSNPTDIFKIERPGLPDLFRMTIPMPDGRFRTIAMDMSGVIQNP